MFASLLTLAAASAPLLPRPNLLRPQFGAFPVLITLLCILWVLLLRWAIPGFGRRATIFFSALCVCLLASWLTRVAGRTWGARYLTPAYHRYVVLPTTVVQVAMQGSLLLAPLWVPLGRLARRKRRLPPAAPPPLAPPAPPAPALDAPSDALPPSLRPAPPLPPSRRDLLVLAPRLIPASSLLLASYGTLIEAQRVVIRRLRIAIPGLPPALAGFRIGQITDLHIARDLFQMEQLQRGLSLLAGERLDILCATGDLCDDPKMYAAVLAAIASVPVRLGHFACIGNHEIYAGLAAVRRAFDRSPVQLLEDNSVRLGALRLAGVGYPMRGRSPRLSMPDLPQMLDDTLRERAPHEETVTVLLAHHPHAIDEVIGRNIALTLSGHTHGGQLGIGTRSLIEPIYRYARGLYHVRDMPRPHEPPGPSAPDTQLFVSSGLGHWLPCRLNCPPEAVILELYPA